MMKRVLLIGACRPGHKALFELGYEIVWLMKKSSAFAVDLTLPYQSIYYYSDMSTQNIVDIVVALHNCRAFDGICTYHDDIQHLAIAISEAIDVQYGVDSRLAELAHDKYQTRQVLQAANIEQVECHLAQDEKSFDRYINQMTFPAIVKPYAGTGSSGISILYYPHQAAEALTRLKACGDDFPVLIEGYLQGREFSVEAISENGQHRIVAVTEKFIDHKTFVEMGHVVPARITDSEHQSIDDYVSRVLTALEVIQGLTHTEVILTAKGPQIIETHTRAGGDRITDLVKFSTHVDLYQLYAKQATGTKIMPLLPDTIVAEQASAVWFLCANLDDNASLQSIENVEEVRGIKYVREVKLMKEPGSRMGSFKDSFSRAAMIVAVGRDSDEALANAQRAAAMLTLKLTWSQPVIEH
ncbi:Carbamoyl-phosphate synthase large chain, putative [Shewanella piezotolerans WP3]|uniref:Carbamoyl-phosphate synthase large chain, putative n=1 Tax=Shewanella piezotolerans (strain WP3 / JCM 13877) TaxID=225849 RepID=B8CTR3_SHEPW|nr:ATP-grasp domain-containing protein [Shewanella piezotolerans]ACJ31307.1 Carbamoyl-phosphate synthase large chain, putative [Shewanella piezotolerans WP3]